MTTLLLDQREWDLVLDVNGNIALADTPYSVAQDVASAVRTFIGECYYDTSLGIPYWQQILGRHPPLSFVKQKIIHAALTVQAVSSAKVVFTNFSGRKLAGQVIISLVNGSTATVAFGD